MATEPVGGDQPAQGRHLFLSNRSQPLASGNVHVLFTRYENNLPGPSLPHVLSLSYLTMNRAKCRLCQSKGVSRFQRADSNQGHVSRSTCWALSGVGESWSPAGAPSHAAGGKHGASVGVLSRGQASSVTANAGDSYTRAAPGTHADIRPNRGQCIRWQREALDPSEAPKELHQMEDAEGRSLTAHLFPASTARCVGAPTLYGYPSGRRL